MASYCCSLLVTKPHYQISLIMHHVRHFRRISMEEAPSLPSFLPSTSNSSQGLARWQSPLVPSQSNRIAKVIISLKIQQEAEFHLFSKPGREVPVRFLTACTRQATETLAAGGSFQEGGIGCTDIRQCWCLITLEECLYEYPISLSLSLSFFCM